MSINAFKISDDHQPLRSTAEGDAFRLRDGSQVAWLAGKTFGHKELRNRIEPWHDDAERQNSAAICCQVFEKIAREGRKFGLGLVLSSRRPSELSPTVLSQCNSYLLHRISNDRDQQLVHKLVPDNLRGLLRDLPSLASRHAIPLRWASELPLAVQMSALPEQHRPKSDDPDFWAVWLGLNGKGRTVERLVNWTLIADDWQQIGPSAQEHDLENNDE
ncbi:ATP-binding protein [Herbaspirillum seropedicae]|uniref:ATP-binding protein n=1 Tax=Herbaspirillum seropedicae TaxID=964 RepID=UPI003FCE2847